MKLSTINFIFGKVNFKINIMIEIARAIEGISINGKEWLLDENGNTMKFESKETAVEFLESKGFEKLSNEEFENSFFFEETD